MGLSPKNRPSGDDSSTNVRLDSWKVIAAYLDRDPRTVQLWEKQEGFPIHRLAHSSRSSVYAFTAEIDAWLHARSSQNAGSSPAGRAGGRSAGRPGRPFWIAVSAVAVLLCIAVAGVAWWIEKHRRGTAVSSPETLAVLPFHNQTASDGSVAYAFTESVTGDIVGLGRVPVVASHPSMELQDVQLPIREVAAQLHASLILRGTVAQAGDQVQVTAELLKGPDFTHIWGATYRRKSALGDSTYEEIASAIAIDVTRRLAGSAPQAVPSQTVDGRARQDYLTARFYWNQRDLTGLRNAIALYRQALAIDPKYADAEAGLAECYDLMTDRGVMRDHAAFTQAKAAAQAALAIDPSRGEAYSALAFAVYRQDWDFARADLLFRKAIALDPDSAVAHQWYGEFLGDMRRFDEAISELRRAQELDPLSPMVGADLANGYMHAGREAEAELELQRILDLYPSLSPAHLYRISLSEREGNLARAQDDAQIYLQLTGDRTPLESVQILQLTAAGKENQAVRQEERLLSPTSPQALGPYARAQLFIRMGRIDAGYAALEQAYREHSWWMVTMMVDPAFATISGQPRFQKIARRVGLPITINPPLLAMSR